MLAVTLDDKNLRKTTHLTLAKKLLGVMTMGGDSSSLPLTKLNQIKLFQYSKVF